MALEMREECERCDTSLTLQADAVICSFECTFCPTCARALDDRCPNCAGPLVRRPPRRTAAVTPKALIRRLHELWTSGELTALEEVYATDFVGHFPSSSHLPERRGIDGVRESIRSIKAAFPDWREDIEDILAEGSRVVTRYTSRGTHRGVFRGIAATGRAVTVPEISIYRLTEGRVAEQWCLVDELGRLQQLGASPPTNG